VVADAGKNRSDDQEDSGDETTPTTTVSECSELIRDVDLESDEEAPLGENDTDGESNGGEDEAVAQLRPGLFPDDESDSDSDGDGEASPAAPAVCAGEAAEAEAPCVPFHRAETEPFTPQETLFIFDWDDTILPSTWIQRQGLRLDSSSVVSEMQKELLGEVAAAAMETLRLAKQHGTVVLLTNAERGWIELSCLKFIPALLPIIEQVKIVSARTSYESPSCPSPLDWKVQAFEAEIVRACGAESLIDPSKRKNIHSLGDSVHEREALMRATTGLPNCYPKSVKFVERPGLGQLLRQHTLVAESFEKIAQHEGHLDICINCT